MLAHPKIDPRGRRPAGLRLPRSVSRTTMTSSAKAIGSRSDRVASCAWSARVGGRAGGVAAGRAGLGQEPVQPLVLDAADVRPAGQRLGRGEQRIQVRVHADGDVGTATSKSPVASRAGGEVAGRERRRASTSMPSRLPVGDDRLRGGEQAGLLRSVGLSTSMVSGACRRRRYQPSSLLRPARRRRAPCRRPQGRSRRRVGSLVERTRATAGSGPSAGRRGTAEDRVDDGRARSIAASSAVRARGSRNSGWVRPQVEQRPP